MREEQGRIFETMNGDDEQKAHNITMISLRSPKQIKTPNHRYWIRKREREIFYCHGSTSIYFILIQSNDI